MVVGEAALLKTAGSIVTPVLRGWMSRARDKRERTSDLSDLINTGITDDLGRRRADRRTAEIVDTVYERLRPLVEGRFAALDDAETVAALEAVTDTFARADFSDRAIFDDNVDPSALAARLRRELHAVPGRAGLSELATRLYAVVLDESCVCVTQLILQLRPFPARASVEILQRLATVSEMLTQALDRLPSPTLDAPAGTDLDSQFRVRYLNHLVAALSNLEIYGVDIHRYRLETQLTVAYISLTVSGDAARLSRSQQRWIPGPSHGDQYSDESDAVRVEQALSLARRMLVRGEAGSGKTTLLQWIAVNAARSAFAAELKSWNGNVPFLIRLRHYADGPLPRPEQFLDGVADALVGLMPASWVHRQLAEGAILCVDGVDEVSEAQRRRVREWLRGLLTAYPTLQVVVTSRPGAAAERWLRPEGFVAANLDRMDGADIRALIRHWHLAAQRSADLPCPSDDVPLFEQRLLAQLDGNAHLQALAANPLLCALLCALNLDRNSHLPRNRMDIYQAAVDMLLQRRDVQRGVRVGLTDLTSRDLIQLLQQVAWWMVLNGRAEATRSQVLQQLEQRLAGMRQIKASGEQVLDHLLQRSGILREPVPGRVDLIHRSFQEYLAAREAAEQGHAGLLVSHGHLDSWRETIVLAAGHSNALVRQELLEGLMDRAATDSRRGRKLRILAAACLETATVVEPPELLERVRGELRRLLPPRSLAETSSLAGIGEPLLDELTPGTGELTDAQAAAVVRCAALIGGPKALELLTAFSNDPRTAVQRELVAAWEYFDPDEYAVRVLAHAPLDNGHVDVRSARVLVPLSKLRNLTSSSIRLDETLEISQLAGVPHLHNLQLWEGLRGDLAQLAEHRSLISLDLGFGNRRADLSVLESLTSLTALWLRDLSNDQDLSPIARLKGLMNLWLLGAPVGDLDFLDDCQALRFLFIEGEAAPDLPVIAALPRLEHLVLSRVSEPEGGIGALAQSLPRLTELAFWGCSWVEDLTAIGRMTQLRKLDIRYTPIGDLRPLTTLRNLDTIYIGHYGFDERNMQPIDVKPLAELPSLRELAILEPTPGLDLTPLQGRDLTVHLFPGVLDEKMASLKGIKFETWP
ncbi:NACHT domain-containing protein [Actinoplanes sp. NPDC048796]|uniref:NACHT domain-containing protein n=1 Tax=Actinoplanes sp. NPDC048796 TaxID=3155640 RepID=UPI0033C0F54C